MTTTLTELELVNIALGHIGVTTVLETFPSFETVEAEKVSGIFNTTRDYVLRQRNWAFATAYATLDLRSDNTDQPWANRWLYCYDLPVDHIRFRRFITANGDHEPVPPPFEIGQFEGDPVVFTDVVAEWARCEYTFRVEGMALFDDTFVQVFTWRLAYMLSFPFSADAEARKESLQMYSIELRTAGSIEANERRLRPLPRSRLVRARFGGRRDECLPPG